MTVVATEIATQYDAVRGKRIEYIEVTGVAPGACTAGSLVDVAITHTGITTSDKVLAVTSLTKSTTTGLLTPAGAVCTTDTITVSFGNPSAGTITGAAVTLIIAVLKAA
ncbi:MAG: hypothetical protein KKD77_24035 [Gammaproteobacteria bacterium]|nr:hypothetical protein [Gammaproteobacteria bacterium]